MRPLYLRAFLPVVLLASAIAAGCENDNGPSPLPCTYTVSTPGTFAAAGGTATITVNALSHCEWAATSNAPWISISSGGSGTGGGSVGVTVAANASTQARTGTVTIADQTVTISQAGAAPQECTYEVSTTSHRFGPAGGNGTVTVTAPADCAWTAVSNVGWISITAGASGSGNGTVAYTVAEYSGSSGRDGTLTIAGKTLNIAQDPQVSCDYSVQTLEFLYHWHGGEGRIQLTASNPSCTWAVTPAANWLHLLTPDAGAGSTEIVFNMDSFLGEPSRTGVIEVRWPTPTAGQNVRVVQEGCRYLIPENDVTVLGDAGTRDVMVIATPVTTECNVGCPWTAVSQDSWIQIVSTMPKAGDEPFRFSFNANPSTTEWRVGHIKVGALTLTVRQQPGS